MKFLASVHAMSLADWKAVSDRGSELEPAFTRARVGSSLIKAQEDIASSGETWLPLLEQDVLVLNTRGREALHAESTRLSADPSEDLVPISRMALWTAELTMLAAKAIALQDHLPPHVLALTAEPFRPIQPASGRQGCLAPAATLPMIAAIGVLLNR